MHFKHVWRHDNDDYYLLYIYFRTFNNSTYYYYVFFVQLNLFILSPIKYDCIVYYSIQYCNKEKCVGTAASTKHREPRYEITKYTNTNSQIHKYIMYIDITELNLVQWTVIDILCSTPVPILYYWLINILYYCIFNRWLYICTIFLLLLQYLSLDGYAPLINSEPVFIFFSIDNSTIE